MPVVYKLKDCCQIIAGQSPESKYYNTNGEGLPFFQGKTDFGVLYPKVRMYCSQPSKIAEKDDILFSVRAPVGPTNLSPGKVCIGRGLTAIRPGKEVRLKYLLYFFRYYEAQLQRSGTGTTFKAITQNVVKNIEVPVPSIEEQERIVSKIEELFSKLDVSVAELQTAKEKLKVYRQAVLKEAFGSMGKEVFPLGDIIEKPKYGTSKKCGYAYKSDSKAVYRIPNICYQNGSINHEDIKYAEFSGDDLKNLDLIENDLLIIRSNGSVSLVGRSAVIKAEDCDATFAGYLIRLRLKKPNAFSSKFLHYFLESHAARTYIERVAKSTSGVNNINSDEISNLPVPRCDDFDVMVQTVEKIETNLSICDSIEQIIDTSLRQAEALRKSILKQAFDGKI